MYQNVWICEILNMVYVICMSLLTRVVMGIPTLWLVKISSGQYNKFSNPTDRMSHGKPTARTISPPMRGPAIYFHFRN
jgi:hypothetical protein